MKDVYEKLSMNERKLIDGILIKSSNVPYSNIKNSKTISEFIDHIVSGETGNGECLQAATNHLQVVYNCMVRALGMGRLFDLDVKKYKSKSSDEPINNKENFTKNNNLYNSKDINEDTEKRHTEEKYRHSRHIDPKEDLSSFMEVEDKHWSPNSSIQDPTLFDKLDNIRNKKEPAYLLAKAIHEDDLSTINKLLTNNNINVFYGLKEQDGAFHPPLHVACQEGKIEIVKLLLSYKYDVNQPDLNDARRIPLSFAVERGHDEICELLINKGADIHAIDNYGRTPFDWKKEIPAKTNKKEKPTLEITDKTNETINLPPKAFFENENKDKKELSKESVNDIEAKFLKHRRNF